MLPNPHIFRAYDIRGIAIGDKPWPDGNIDLSEETMYLIGKGFGTYIQKHFGPNVVVGRDVRTTGEKLQKAYIKGLLETGCNVTDIGLSTSPMLYYAVCKYGFDGGTNITASHNPKEYNGAKLVGKNGHSICGDEIQTIYEIIKQCHAEKSSGRVLNSGKLETRDINNDYVNELLTKVKLERPLKIVIDAGNGTSGPLAPELFRRFGCEVIELFCEPDGNFPNHLANPEEPENVADLIQKVKETNADLGIAFDGDGDRIGVIGENGKIYSADFLLLILARDLLTRHPNAKIVFDVKTSQVVEAEIKRLDGQGLMNKTGHSFIEQRMKKEQALLAGEVSGHMFFGENYYGFDDAFLAALKILSILSQSPKKFSEHFTDLPQTHTTPEIKAPCPDEIKFKILDQLVADFCRDHQCIAIDGARINFDQKSWGLIRCSNTTPNLTLRFEAESPEKLTTIQKIVYDKLKEHPEVDLTNLEKSLAI